ncbi:retropepsin-like aspartic protease [Nonomuraea typhae]|uniref:retropepsin-like aspartic protease n=1 Tax=Nonomuraea typhae TaxID=2603600 RepID=UPI0012FA1FA7|nr:retropepsin-like aspartic protease [Nonomuraea typhae]
MSDLDRRRFLQTAGLAAAALPLLDSAPAHASGQDPDALFKQGRFAEAERGYRRLLLDDPKNARATGQLGYLALLSNRFRRAETFLTRAIRLNRDDLTAKQRLAECYVRQDQPARAVPLLRATGRPRDKVYAELFSHVEGRPWQIHGARRTRVPFHTLDPVPSVEASVNGGRPQKFYLDTYATLDLSEEAAKKAGVRPVATWSGGMADNHPITIYLGVLDSFRIGDIEIRNIPMQWSDVKRPTLPDGSEAAGAFGTTIFYHCLATMDYAGRALVLRRRSELPVFRAEADRSGSERLPFWLAGDHFPCTLGSLRDYGPRMVTVDTGGIGSALGTTVEIAERAGFEVDYEHPNEVPGNKIYPLKADRISLGRAVGRDLPGTAEEKAGPGTPGPGQSAQFGFDLIANFSHEFFKPFAITFDYTGMRLYITGESL